MQTLIVYASKHGCTEKCAMKLMEKLKGQIDLASLKTKPKINFEKYDTIIIGGSIHAGRIQKRVKEFCGKHADQLLTKKLGLFLCCMEEGDTARKQFDEAFPEDLRNHAKATGLFGGEFNFEKMNAIERAIIRKIVKPDQSVSKIDEEAIEAFIKDLNQ